VVLNLSRYQRFCEAWDCRNFRGFGSIISEDKVKANLVIFSGTSHKLSGEIADEVLDWLKTRGFKLLTPLEPSTDSLMESHAAHYILLVSDAQNPDSSRRQVRLDIACDHWKIVFFDVLDRLPCSDSIKLQRPQQNGRH